jgi:hypothetical protein
MTPDALLVRDLRFRIGWIVLLIVAGLMALMHFASMFIIRDEFTLFAGFAAFYLYAFVVVWIPFRRRERWAWFTSWILPIASALVALMANDPRIPPLFYAVAAICTLGLLVTMRDFR